MITSLPLHPDALSDWHFQNIDFYIPQSPLYKLEKQDQRYKQMIDRLLFWGFVDTIILIFLYQSCKRLSNKIRLQMKHQQQVIAVTTNKVNYQFEWIQINSNSYKQIQTIQTNHSMTTLPSHQSPLSPIYESIQKLLQFQNSFLNLVHAQVLCHDQQEKRKQALLKLQVLQLSDKNEIFNDIIVKLKKQLIEQKQQQQQQCTPTSDSLLRGYFLKLLQLDYLPLLHVNRYELTKLAIFGFDIYIDPLEAILQILNRLERVLYIMEDCLKDGVMTEVLTVMVSEKKTLADMLLMGGWKAYYCLLHVHRLTLNVYMLKQYINVATTSLPKKDKQLIFTGAYNLYKRLIPLLTSHHLVPQLQQLGDLNNTLYNFHGSFDYFVFYSYMQPTEQYLPVFNKISEIEKKCRHTNILTPILFGVMNNYGAFVRFIDRVEDVGYGHWLRVLLAGLVVNFKLRILEYNQVLQLIGLVINKLCLMGKLSLTIITSQLPKQWQQARQFFISAFKSGYNPGQIQAWTLCDIKLIQPTIICFLIKGLLLTANCRNDSFIKGLQREQLLQVIDSEIKELTDGVETLGGLANNWKQLDVGATVSTTKCLNILRIINLAALLQLNSQRLVYSIVSALTNTNITQISSPLLKSTLLQSIQTLNEVITSINRKQLLTNLKEVLVAFHAKYPPRRTFEDVVPVYLHSFIVREAIVGLLGLLGEVDQNERKVHIRQVLTALVHKYFSKPLEHGLDHETYKSFDKQYKIPTFISTIDPQPNTIYSNLVKIITSTQQTQSNKRNIAFQMLLNLAKHSPHHIINILNLPAVRNDKIGSFLDWLINAECEVESRRFIVTTLGLLNQFADKTQSILDFNLYLHECYYLNVLDSILSSLAELIEKDNWCDDTGNVHKSLCLIDLFVEIYQTNTIRPNTLSLVWMNLTDLIAYIFKNAQYQTQTIIRGCKLYWKVVQITKREGINLWYQKLIINRIFSTLTTQNLLFNGTFKGITLISSIKNYLISKQTNSQHHQNVNEKPQRYAFSNIKGFFENNYEAIGNDGKANASQIEKFFTLIKQSRSEPKPIKAQIHIMSEKDMPACLSQKNMQMIYDKYCKSKALGQQTKELQFCLLLLALNPVNHRTLWNLIMRTQSKTFLSQLSFTRQTINEVLQVVRHLETHLQSKSQQQLDERSLQSEVEVRLRQMLGLDLIQNSISELQLLASGYYFQQSKLQPFMRYRSALWFLIVCNNSSWREFTQIFSTHLKSCCFLSNLLQYKQYLTITRQANNDYQQKIQQFSSLIDQYVFYVEKKLDSIDLQRVSDSEKENVIRRSTLVINIKVLVLKCEMEKMLEKVAILLKEVHQNLLDDTKFKALLKSLHSLNKLSNQLLGGNIKLPTFTYHNLYTTSESDEKQFFLGTWIEQCEKEFENNDSLQIPRSSYVPEKEFYLQMETIQDFISICKDQDTNMRKVLDTKIDKNIIHKEYLKLKQSLKDYLQPGESTIALKHENCPQAEITLLNKFYCLGYLHFILNNQKLPQQDDFGLSLILRNLTKRQKISMQVIKEIDVSAYHQLKVLIMNDKLSIGNKKNIQSKESEQKEEQKILFVWNNKELLPKGVQITLNDQNKELYLQLISDEILGISFMKLNKSFAMGFINASMSHRNF